MRLTHLDILSVVISLLIFSCNDEDLNEQNAQEFIEYSMDNGESILITENINVVFNGNDLNIQTSDDDCFRVIGYLPNPYNLGSYETYIITGESPVNAGFVIVSSSGQCTPTLTNGGQNVVYTLNNWGEPGEFIDVNFNGTILDIEFNSYTISGVIHVIRDE